MPANRMLHESPELAQVFAEADDIARSVGQEMTSAHVLLALFTVANPAEALLRERSIDEDRVLLALDGAGPEEPGGVRLLRERTREIALSTASPEVDCLHLLVAMARLQNTLACRLLDACGLPLAAVRNQALSYITGRVPQRLLVKVPAKKSASRAALEPAPRVPPEPAPRAEPRRPEAEQRRADAEPRWPEPEPIPEPEPAPEPAHGARAAAAPEPDAPAAPERPAARYFLDPETFPWLSSMGKNLSALAAEGKIDPVVGRDREVEEVLDILGKRRTNNPCLVGEPGVGKTAIVEGVAQRLVDASDDRIIVELDMATVVAGTQLRGSFSERLNGIKEEMRKAGGRVVAFIDELHTLVGAGSTGDGPQDAANELKAALARGEFPCIGATTHDEFRKYIGGDPALERRFTPVLVQEPSPAQAVEILRGVIDRYAAHHGVTYAASAVEAAAWLTARYVPERRLPDKAIAALDLAGSRARREGSRVVGRDEVARAVAKMAAVPEERLLEGEGARLLRLEEALKKRVVGQDAAVAAVARAVRRGWAGFSARRPVASFIFVGPTGVGKTELARALAVELFGTEQALVRLDMSEFSEAHTASRLTGAPPGYVGYGEGGALTEPVRRRPACVVLFDEVEKAHRAVIQHLLAVLDEGAVTDSTGRRVDFTSSVVVLTTNLGAEAFGKRAASLGFGAPSDNAEARALSAARAGFPPELWSRIEERLVFAPLSREEVVQVALRRLNDGARRLAEERKVTLLFDDALAGALLDMESWAPELGARMVRQAIQRQVEAPLAEAILRGEVGAGDRVRLVLDGGRVAFRVV